MKSVAKIAISVPMATLKSLERERLARHQSRSAAVTEAIEYWLASESSNEADRAYVSGYLKHPERVEDAAATARAAVQAWDPWQ
jgi:hypothetical protein